MGPLQLNSVTLEMEFSYEVLKYICQIYLKEVAMQGAITQEVAPKEVAPQGVLCQSLLPVRLPQRNWGLKIQALKMVMNHRADSEIFDSKHKHCQNASMCTEVRICVTVRENRFYLNRHTHTHTLRTALCIVETAAALGRDAPSPKYAMQPQYGM